jgi:hypothetical protein
MQQGHTEVLRPQLQHQSHGSTALQGSYLTALQGSPPVHWTRFHSRNVTEELYAKRMNHSNSFNSYKLITLC